MKRGSTSLRTLIAGVILLMGIILASAQAGAGGGVVVGSDTGGTGGDGSGQAMTNYTVLVKIEEKLHAWTDYIVSGAMITPNTDRHVVRLKIACPYTVTTTPDATGYWIDTSFITALGVPVGTELGADGTPPTIFLSPYGSGYLPNPPEQCATVLFGNSYTPTQSPATWYVDIQRGASGILTGGQVKYWGYFIGSGKHYNTEGQQDGSRTNPNAGWHATTLNLDKIELTSISLDARKVYGKANLDGELPGDPNAERSNNNFQPWIFRGGHFVGNMGWGSSKDLSGTARTQYMLTSMGDSDNYLAGCLTMFATGTRGTFSSGTIGLYRPSSITTGTPAPPALDLNLNTGLLSIWDNRWNIDPAGTQAFAGDYRFRPYYSVSPTTTDQNNYLNWQMPYADAIWRKEYGGDNTTATKKMWQYVALCQNNEAPNTWQYFGSTWLEGVTGQVFPLTDSRPRIWKVR